MNAMIGDATTLVQTAWWAPVLAFLAGLLSFASPCVLPLVPGYLAFVTGERATAGVPAAAGAPAAAGPGKRSRVGSLVPVLLFILGFTVVFTVLFGFAASGLSRWIRSPLGQRFAGVVVIVFGAFMLLYAFRAGMPWLYREERPLLSRVKPGPAWAFPLGMAFAAGWTPCVGPVLGAIVTLAATQSDTARTVFLLFVYSLGLGVPFLLVGLGMVRLGGARFFSRNYHWFAGVSGVIMVTIGILLVSGLWVRLLSPVLRWVNGVTPAL
jgi:cytochrome c-type biogenesis protein